MFNIDNDHCTLLLLRDAHSQRKRTQKTYLLFISSFNGYLYPFCCACFGLNLHGQLQSKWAVAKTARMID